MLISRKNMSPSSIKRYKQLFDYFINEKKKEKFFRSIRVTFTFIIEDKKVVRIKIQSQMR